MMWCICSHLVYCCRLAIILGTVFGCVLFLIGLIILLICCTKDRCFQKVSPRKGRDLLMPLMSNRFLSSSQPQGNDIKLKLAANNSNQ